MQVVRVFGSYAADRSIDVGVDIEPDLVAPLVPVSLYGGIALNLFTNALKAVTAKAGSGEKRIVFKAWNEDAWHLFEVSDTGIGIPSALRERVFDLPQAIERVLEIVEQAPLSESDRHEI